MLLVSLKSRCAQKQAGNPNSGIHMMQKALTWLSLSQYLLLVMQVQLLTVLVRLEEVPPAQVRDVYKLLLDDSHAVRHAAAELVTDMLEESGQRHLAQVIVLLTL